MPSAGIEIGSFSKETLRSLLGDGTSAEYLLGYLGELKARSVLLEGHYVDRHYLDDFVHYYARSFHAPDPHCRRAHFFGLPPSDLDEILSECYELESGRSEASSRLQAHYLGFVVIRPLAGAPVGRTVLKTYPVDGSRLIEVIRPYRVNVAGLELTVEGLAYQQQDGGAAVCASTALWSALQRVAYVAGNRTPTPSAVTRASGSPFPASHGLHNLQMATALNSLGYVADTFSPGNNRPLFKAKVASLIESQLPVILLLEQAAQTSSGIVRSGHAVTVTGFRAPPAAAKIPVPWPFPDPEAEPLRMSGAALSVVYVHDDNLGSHAHYEFVDSDEPDFEGSPKLQLLRGRGMGPNTPWWTPDLWDVTAALVPKPEKLRLPIDDVFASALWIRWVFQSIFSGMDLDFAVRFQAGVEYKRHVLDLPLDRTRLRSFVCSLTLPRQVGVISINGPKHLCDLLVDVSEVHRNPGIPSVVGLVAPGVALHSAAWKNLTGVASLFGCPLLSAPPTL